MLQAPHEKSTNRRYTKTPLTVRRSARLAEKSAKANLKGVGDCLPKTLFPVDAGVAADDTQEACSHTLSILGKIEDISNKLQILRKQHANLCNEVKGITVDSLLGSEAITALQNQNVEHELLRNKYHDLRKKYHEECSERKKLGNELIDLKGKIRVFCRCRPLTEDEIEKGLNSVVDYESSQENELQIILPKRRKFKFDHVFRPEDNQEAVFVQTMPMVTSVLDGYNVCIFAYGQTGTGKTYTMEGTPENRGVNYRTVEELFRISGERSSIMRYEFLVSMLEVYNEKIRDLLAKNSNSPAKKLDIKQSVKSFRRVTHH